MKILLAAPLALLLAGCHNPAPGYTPVAPPEVPTVDMTTIKSPKDLMPLEVGNVWQFALQTQEIDRSGKSTNGRAQNAEIEIESRWPDGTAVLVFRLDGKIADRQAWHAAEDGLYQVEGSIGGVSVRPPMPLFPVPLKAGQKFKWHGRAPSMHGVSSPSNETAEILNPQKVDTANGSVSAVPVLSHTVYVDGENDSTTWFQPGKGIVRVQSETKTKSQHTILTFTLTSHTTKS